MTLLQLKKYIYLKYYMVEPLVEPASQTPGLGTSRRTNTWPAAHQEEQTPGLRHIKKNKHLACSAAHQEEVEKQTPGLRHIKKNKHLACSTSRRTNKQSMRHMFRSACRNMGTV